MRRIICIVVAILLSVSSVAFSTELNVNEMGLEELLKLRERITSEIDERISASSYKMYPGDYYVCDNPDTSEFNLLIKSGLYLMAYYESWVDTANYVTITAYEDRESYEQLDYKRRLFSYLYEGHPAIFNLSEGMIVEQRGGITIAQPINKMDYMP